MQYLGSKRHYARKIVEVIREDSSAIPRITNVYDLCCGTLSMSMAFIDAGFRSVAAIDACEPLVRMYEAARDGWMPPNELSEAEWAALRDEQDPTNPMTAFAGFGCSYGGRWFAGYARGRYKGVAQSYAAFTTAGVLKRCPYLRLDRLALSCGDALATSPAKGDVVYVDPPYEGTIGYGAMPEFKHEGLWAKCRVWREAGAYVYVSGYESPPGFVQTHYAQRARRNSMGVGKIERLYRLP